MLSQKKILPLSQERRQNCRYIKKAKHMAISLGGFFSGLDTTSLIEQIIALDSQPIINLQNQKLDLSDKKTAYGAINSSLTNLQNLIQNLNDPVAFKGKSVTSSSNIGATTASTSASPGTISINVQQIATASSLTSGFKATDKPAASALATSVFGSSASGYFTINNTQITIGASTTLSDIINQINSSVPGVTASYDAATGKFSLSSNTKPILGSSGDTSNFLQGAQLFNNNISSGPPYTVSSNTGVGRLDLTQTIGSISNFGGIAGSIAGNGSIDINGVSISYSSTDTLETVLNNITNSDAGVIATYDSYSDQVVLTAKNRGSVGISVANGQLAQALGLRTGVDTQVTLGNDTLFQVNGGPVRQSADATLSEDELGYTGLTFTPTSTGSTTLTVGSDVAAIKTLIDNFINQYNSSQNVISSYTKIDTSNTKNNGLLASDTTVNYLPNTLRTAMTGVVNSTGTIRMLEDLGITANSTDNTLTVSDSSKLQDALNNHLDEVISLFTSTDPTNPGLASRMDSLLNSYTSGTSGALPLGETTITQQQKYIDDQIALLQAQLDAEKAYLQQQFAALETTTSNSQRINSLFSGSDNASSGTTS